MFTKKQAHDVAHYLTMEQVADKFQVTAATVRRWIHAGQLKAIQVGRLYRVTEEECEAMFERGRDAFERVPTDE